MSGGRGRPHYRLCLGCGRPFVSRNPYCPECEPGGNYWWAQERKRRHQKLAGRDTRHWRRVAALTKARDGYRCVDCGTPEIPGDPRTKLAVDLVNPDLGGDHSRATEDDGETRCASCHTRRHNRERSLGRKA